MSDKRFVSYKPPNTPPEQDWYWTEEWQKGERESMAAYARGDYVHFDTVDEAIAWLQRDDDDG